MKFSLRFFLFIVPCILVAAYFVIWHVGGYFNSKREDKSFPYWFGTSAAINALSDYLLKEKITLNQLSITDLNLWLRKDLPATAPVAMLLETYGYPYLKTDSWDHALVAVALDETNLPTHDSNKAKTIGIYSNGRDGVSKSIGCDPDDLASWRMEAGLAYYEELEQNNYWQSRKIRALVTLVVGTFGVLLLWLVGVFGYRMLIKKA